MIDRFLREAYDRFPDEHAAWLVWNEATQALEYRGLEVAWRHGAGIEVHRPRLEEHEHLAVDLHSHGRHKAFFSRTDNEDGHGEFKIAGVFGSMGQDTLTSAFRLCAGGLYIDLPGPAAGKEAYA